MFPIVITAKWMSSSVQIKVLQRKNMSKENPIYNNNHYRNLFHDIPNVVLPSQSRFFMIKDKGKERVLYVVEFSCIWQDHFF